MSTTAAEPCARAFRVLVVEDQWPTFRLIQAALRQYAVPRRIDLDFAYADTASSAMTMILAEAPDLILLDLYLADDVPGEQLLADLRSRGISVRTIILSGLDPRFDGPRIAAVRDLGPAEVLAKPTPWPEVARVALAPFLPAEAGPEGGRP